MKKQLFLILLTVMGHTIAFSSLAFAGQAILSWNPNTESDFSGYKVFYSTLSGSYPNVLDVGKTATPHSPQYTVTNLTEGTTYYFAVKSYDYSLNQSGFSQEVWKTIVVSDPDPPPPDPITDPSPSENLPPVANAGADQAVLGGTEVHLNGGGSSDPDGDSLTYFWIQTSGSAVTVFDPTLADPSFFPEMGGNYEFSLIVSDGSLESSPDRVTIVVNVPGNTTPVSEAGVNQIVETGGLVVLNGSGSHDENSDLLSYQWTQTRGTPVNLQGSDSAILQFYPVDTGTYAFDLVVNDGRSESSPDTVEVFVMDQILTEQTVTPQDGGTLSITDGELSGAKLVIPPGAVAQDIEIAVGLDFSLPPLNGQKFTGEAASFEPAGTRFAKPVSVVFPVDLSSYSNSDNLKAYLFDEPTKTWNPVPITGIDTTNGLITAKIDHFSSFTVALDKGGPAAVSDSSINGGFGCGAIVDSNGRGGNPPPSLDFLLLGVLIIWFPLLNALRSKVPVFLSMRMMASSAIHEIPGIIQPGKFVMVNRLQYRA